MTPYLFCMVLAIGHGSSEPTATINQHFNAYWREHKITASQPCTDHEFLRRVSLDLIGRIPTVAEMEAYLKDAPEQRRRLLIDRLLKHEESPRHWANVWNDWLLDGGGPHDVQRAFHGWLEQQLAKQASLKDIAAQLITATGTTADNPAVHFTIVHRGQAFPKKDWRDRGQHDMLPLADRTARVFAGKALACVQCHDNPFDDEFRQEHLYNLAAFFRQVEIAPGKAGTAVSDNREFNVKNIVDFERRNGVVLFTQPTYLDGKKIPRDFKGTRREALVQMVVANPWFAKAHVNRMWTHFFGHSLSKHAAWDEAGDENPIVHPGLLDDLADAFVKSGYDSAALARWIVLSDPYARSSIANKTNDTPDKLVAFSRMRSRHLTNEQLVESLLAALGQTRDAAKRAKLRELWLFELSRPRFDTPTECEVVPLRYNDTMLTYRMMWLTNSESFHEALKDKDGTLATVNREHAKPSPVALNALFRHTLGRPMIERERQRLMQFAQPPGAKQPVNWHGYCEDVFWALLNSAEFGLNH
jgi:hypothetical protein